MSHDDSATGAKAAPALPPDDATRKLVVANSDMDANLPHVSLVGDTYTIMVSGADTAGRYCLIDMFIPPGGGPGPHRHDFEESFTLLEGELEFTFRGVKTLAQAGATIAIPANAPHMFHNASDKPARLLCICAPAGQDEFFRQIGVAVPTRTTAAAPLDAEAEKKFKAKAAALAPRFRTELLERV